MVGLTVVVFLVLFSEVSICFQAHVNHLSLKAPRFKEHGGVTEVCLVDTLSRSDDQTTQGSERLFTAHLLIADKGSPDFATKYANTRHSLVCEFRVLKVSLPLFSINLFCLVPS